MARPRKQHPNIFASFPLVEGMSIHCYGLFANHLASRLAYHWKQVWPLMHFQQSRSAMSILKKSINLILNDVEHAKPGDILACCTNGSDVVFRFERNGKEVVEMIALPELHQVIGGAPYELGRTHV